MDKKVLPAAVLKVSQAAAALGIPVEIRDMPDSTRTAAEAAAAVGCSVGEIVKSLVFRGRDSGSPYLLLVSGANRVNEDAVASQIGEPLDRPDAAFVRTVTGFAIGGIPPFGHAATLPTFLDRDLLAHPAVWAAAGTPHALFRTDPAALRDAVAAHVIDVK